MNIKTTLFYQHARRLKHSITNAIERVSYAVQDNIATGGRERSLIILDDFFPNRLSAFRVAEFNAYLEHWQDAVVYSTGNGYVGAKKNFSQALDEYLQFYPQFRSRILPFSLNRHFHARLLYSVFLFNAYAFIDIAERYQISFAFTLYPGGGFALNEPESDRRLERVCASPVLKKIIVTQKISYEYLRDRQLCDLAKVELIYGGVFPSSLLLQTETHKKQFKSDKKTFDVCFVANRYTKHGTDKGYDVFIQVAQQLSRMTDDIFFHVVGTFGESDLDLGDCKSRVRFYGSRTTDFFPSFYAGMDVILSPNLPFVLAPGAFDGFPTGGCIEAGLCGVAVFCTDPLNQNVVFKDRQEIVIIKRDVDSICDLLCYYHSNLDSLYDLAQVGQRVFRRVFDITSQIEFRSTVLSTAMKN
jgi:glycosyltransferase involved in cell wall biosynthesis